MCHVIENNLLPIREYSSKVETQTRTWNSRCDAIEFSYNYSGYHSLLFLWVILHHLDVFYFFQLKKRISSTSVSVATCFQSQRTSEQTAVYFGWQSECM